MDVTQKSVFVKIVFVCVLMALAWSGVLDGLSKEYANHGIVQVGAFFGVIRSLNAVVSMFQEVEINLFITQMAIGELLDPLNDLVEYISEGLKIALGSYLLQRVIIEVTSNLLFNIVLTFSGVAYIASLFTFPQSAKAVVFKTFVSLVFIRFAVTVMMLATTAFSIALLDNKIAAESKSTELLSAELNETRRVAENVSDNLAQTIYADIQSLEQQKNELMSEIKPLRKSIRGNRYAMSKKDSEINKLKKDMTLVKSFKGNETIESLESEIESLEQSNSDLEERINELNDKVAFVEDELESTREYLYEESSGFINKLTQGVGSAWSYISELTTNLVDATMTALVLFMFKMLLLPILFLYVLLKLFKYLWGIELSDAVSAAASEVKTK